MLLCIMLYVMLAYLLLFAALSNAVCSHNASFFLTIYFCKCFFVIMLCPGLFTRSLFISSMIYHHAQCF